MGRDKQKKIPNSRIAAELKVRKSVPAAAARASLVEPSGENVVIRWTFFDFDGPWCIGASDSAVIVKLMQRLQKFETMRPREVFSGGDGLGKEYDVANIPNTAARTRLTDLGFADQTRIARVRIDGPGRFYGFRRDPQFYALWWDPNHEIWPSALKHT